MTHLGSHSQLIRIEVIVEDVIALFPPTAIPKPGAESLISDVSQEEDDCTSGP